MFLIAGAAAGSFARETFGTVICSSHFLFRLEFQFYFRNSPIKSGITQLICVEATVDC